MSSAARRSGNRGNLADYDLLLADNDGQRLGRVAARFGVLRRGGSASAWIGYDERSATRAPR